MSASTPNARCPSTDSRTGYFDHGYARTGYKTQGATADRVFTFGDDGDFDRQAAYTALSEAGSRTGSTCSNPTRTSKASSTPTRGAQRPEGRELLLEHAERELSRDRSQHQASEMAPLDPLAAELLARLPEPEATPSVSATVPPTSSTSLPEPDTPRAHSSLADDLLADLPDPTSSPPRRPGRNVTARLDRMRAEAPPSVADDFGIDLW